MDLGKVVCQVFGAKEVVSILTVGKVVRAEIGAGHDDLVVNTIEFHML